MFLISWLKTKKFVLCFYLFFLENNMFLFSCS